MVLGQQEEVGCEEGEREERDLETPVQSPEPEFGGEQQKGDCQIGFSRS